MLTDSYSTVELANDLPGDGIVSNRWFEPQPDVDLTPPTDFGLDDSTVSRPQAFLNADERQGVSLNGKPSFTIDQAAAQLTSHVSSDGVTRVPTPPWGSITGHATTVTYGYRSTAPVNMPEDTAGFERFNAAQIDMTELALKSWSDVANITFVRIGTGDVGEFAYTDNATILFGDYTSGADGAAAFGYFPGLRSAGASAGDVWINSTLDYNANPTLWDYGAQVLVHELGHAAIGLSHPGNYDADADTVITYDADAVYYEDSREYTVMSYFGSTNTGGSLPAFASAPQLDDIRAAQIQYGANMTTRTGDTVYGFHSNAGAPWFNIDAPTTGVAFSVWDAGGKDTFDFSGYSQNQVIDLRQGYFSSVGGSIGNVSIAEGVDIENAIGGSGSDTMHGNALSNSISGGSGNDTIEGGTDGSNYLRGDDGNDTVSGGGGFDDINGNKGNDVAHGGAGDDWVVGGQDNDKLFGDVGGDIVYGNLGDDTTDGGAGADLVRGGQGNDILTGGDGDDWLSGDRGNDTITGGAGADIFHGSQDAGIDRITDFNYGEGDRVQLDAGTTYTVAQQGADTVLTMGPGHQMILVGVQLSSLGSGWILGT